MKHLTMSRFLVLALAALLPLGCARQATKSADASAAAPAATLRQGACDPIDFRDAFGPDAFVRTADGEWETAERPTPAPFDELIYSWAVKLPPKEGFRLHLRVRYTEPDAQGATHSPWLYGGYWGEVEIQPGRTVPKFDHGSVEMDQLLMTRTASAYQFRLTSEGTRTLTTIPSMHAIATNNFPGERLCREFPRIQTLIAYPPMVLDLPLRRQEDSKGTPTPDRCQSAAVATAMEYFGTSVPLENIIAMTFDPEYDYPGIWPRTIGAATQLGFDGYIDRFRDWHSVRATLAQNKVILCSIRMPKDGNYIAPPYESMGGHIVALNGFTEDGQVIITDSALGKDGRGFRCQWLPEDFEKVWMKTKGGVGMVIDAPGKEEPKLVEDIPPFPRQERERMKTEWAKKATP